MTNLEYVDQFLNETKVFFLSTTDGDQPKTRPLNVHLIHDGKLCFLTGDKKEVYHQLMNNHKIQIVALNHKTEWLRIEGTASLCSEQETAENILKNSPFLRKNYGEMGMNLRMFQIDAATVEKRTWELLDTFDLYEA